jgi:hypothetical protein
MEKEFVPYELALRMKQLGFDEECIAYYQKSAVIGNDNILPISFTNMASDFNDYEYSKLGVPFYSAPTWQQAFRWFREKYQIHHRIDIQDLSENLYDYEILEVLDGFNDLHSGSSFKSYKEAEFVCLEKLIEIVEQTNQNRMIHI